MNLMWFENFWIVGGVALPLVLVLVVCLFFVFVFLSMLILNSSPPSNFNSSFAVTVLLFSVPTSPFSVLTFVIFVKGSNSDALRPFSNWDFEPYDWALWRNPLEFEFLRTGSNWDFEPPFSNWHFEPYGWALWRSLLGIWHFEPYG